MKIMQVSVSIDVNNADHREALNTFMEALGAEGVKVTEKAPKKESKKAPKGEVVDDDDDDEDDDEESEDWTKTRASVRAKAKDVGFKFPAGTKRKEDMVEALEEYLADLDDDEDDDEDEEPITRATLRERASILGKAGHRKAIKEKLAELGASNLSKLDEDDFEEFSDFLAELD